MAQEIMVAGAIYEDVPSVRLPDSHGTFHPFVDTSDTTAVAADVAQGKTFHLADGSAATGTAAGATLVTKSITANGTYDAGDDGADGYSEVTVNVSGGGGGGGVDPKDVNFIDYDGTVLHAYTAAEFAALTALPENPTHDGLVAQGWNWTLADAQSYVAEYGILTIGQMYVTASGDTEIDIELVEGRLSPYLGLAPNGTVTIDWGDGSTPDTVTGTSLTTIVDTRHDYAGAGTYTIRVRVESGSLCLQGVLNGKAILHGGSGTSSVDNFYASCVSAVRMAQGVGMENGAFANCTSMASISIPAGVASVGTNVFYATGLTSATVPGGVTSTGGNVFSQSTKLRYVSLPKSIASFTSYAFNSASSLRSLALPPSITTLPGSTFSSNRALRRVSIPNGVTTIENSAIYGCWSLVSIVLPSSLTSIDKYALYGCNTLTSIHFTSARPPAVAAANVFTALPTDCKIYVPAGSLSAYTSAANYPSSSTYTYVEE